MSKIGALLLIVISSITIDFIQLLIFYKVYKTMDAMNQETARYLKEVTETSIDLIKKASQNEGFERKNI